jgi:holo-[acyl-carrier protein] synthase
MNYVLPTAGILVGLGADLIEVARIRAVVERHGDRFLDRILTDEERAYCAGLAAPYPHIAARFAVKEAVAKAFTTGIGAEFGWKSVGVRHGPRREPLAQLDAQGEALLRRVGATHVMLTLSHTENYAMAVAALVRQGP